MFEVFEYTRGKKAKRPKLRAIREFPTIEAARKYTEGQPKTIIRYSKKAIEELNQ